MRLRITLLIGILCFGFINILLSQSPQILWRFNTHDESFGNAAIGKLTGDGSIQIAFSCYWGDSNIYVLNAADGSLVWKRNMGGCNDAAPIIYDVDSSGQLDVILASSCNPVLTCFNGKNGTTKWQTAFGGSDSPPSIADIDGDGKPEILVGDFEGYLNCFTADSGKLKWRVAVDTNSTIEASPALVDINGDGHPDIIVCTWAYGGNGDSTAIYAYDGVTHKLIWKDPRPTDKIYHGAAFGNIIENGKPQLAISSYDGHVYLLNGPNDSLIWAYPTPGLAYIGDPVAIGSLHNNGHLDMVYSNGNGEVDALDRFGNLEWSFFLPLYESSFRGATLADVNNDDTLDVVFAASDGKVYALNGSNGSLLWDINLRADYGDSNFTLEHGAVVASFKQDDTLDVFVVGGYTDYPNIQNDFGRAYALKIGVGTGPDWGMFQHDYTRSNCVCNLSPFTGFTEVNTPQIKVNDYPNPFSQTVNFNITLDRSLFVSVIIYDELGKAVKTFSNKTIAQGNYQFTWNGTDNSGNIVPQGVYYCRILAGNTSVTKKLVFIH
jgi:outer membrane protein assembly factor BamB